jgi:DNA-binding beta-propeller fold protein YncE
VSNFHGNTIYFIDLTSLPPTLLGSVRINISAEDIALSPDGRWAVVSDGGNEDHIVLIDVVNRAFVQRLALPGLGASLQAVAVAADGEVVLVADSNNDRVYLVRLNSEAGELTFEGLNWQTGDSPINIAISPDGRTALVANFWEDTVTVLRIDGPRNVVHLGKVSGLPEAPQSIAFSLDGRKAYVVSTPSKDEDRGSTEPLDQLAVLNVNGPGDVTDSGIRVNLRTKTSCGWFGIDVLAISPDGRKAYVGNPCDEGDSVLEAVTIVDLVDYRVTGQIPAGRYPVGIAFFTSATTPSVATPAPTVTRAPMQTATPITTPDATACLRDDFDDPTSGWQVYTYDDGQVGYEDGEYHVWAEPENWIYWSRRGGTYRDFDVRVKARALGRNVDGAFSIAFRYVDGDNFYLFSVSPSAGEYKLEKQVNDEWVTVHDWTSSPHINLGLARNELRVLAQGSNISLYVNDRHLMDVHDTSFAEGQIALAAWNFENRQGTHVHFDNFQVCDLNPTVTPPAPPPSGQLILSDDFSDPTSGWQVWSDADAEVRYEDSEYHVLVSGQNLVAWGAYGRAYGDFDVSVKARAQEGLQCGNDNNCEVAAGLIFRQQDNDNFYLFRVSLWGWYQFLKHVGDTWVTIIPWTSSPHVNLGLATNEFRIIAQGTTLRLYLNGRHLVDVTDMSFSEGRFALAATNWETLNGAHIHFDDFVLYGSSAMATIDMPDLGHEPAVLPIDLESIPPPPAGGQAMPVP